MPPTIQFKQRIPMLLWLAFSVFVDVFSIQPLILEPRFPWKFAVSIKHFVFDDMDCLITFLIAGSIPFQVGFVTDQNELIMNAAVNLGVANNHELQTEPGGIIGFQLDYRQVAC